MKDYFGKWTDWYWERFLELSSLHQNYKKAWEALEEEHYEKFHFYKYESYSTFRAGKTARFKQNQRSHRIKTQNL